MKTHYLYLVVVIILTSCAAPAPIIRLSPSTVQTKDYWNMGQQFVYENNKNVWFDCGFNRCENGKVIYDVKVTNLSDSSVTVDPAQFTQQVYKNDNTKIASNNAFDPELTLVNLQLDANMAKADASNAAALGICSIILAAGAGIAVAASDTKQENKQMMYDAISVTNDIAQTAAASSRESNTIKAENSYYSHSRLSESLLRRTTLPKGFYIDGEVQFPYNEEANWYELNLFAGDAKVDFLFNQHLIYPNYQTPKNY